MLFCFVFLLFVVCYFSIEKITKFLVNANKFLVFKLFDQSRLLLRRHRRYSSLRSHSVSLSLSPVLPPNSEIVDAAGAVLVLYTLMLECGSPLLMKSKKSCAKTTIRNTKMRQRQQVCT